MGELARLFGQLTPVKYPSLSPIACSKSSLVVPACAHLGLRVKLFGVFVSVSLNWSISSNHIFFSLFFYVDIFIRPG